MASNSVSVVFGRLLATADLTFSDALRSGLVKSPKDREKNFRSHPFFEPVREDIRATLQFYEPRRDVLAEIPSYGSVKRVRRHPVRPCRRNRPSFFGFGGFGGAIRAASFILRFTAV